MSDKELPEARVVDASFISRCRRAVRMHPDTVHGLGILLLAVALIFGGRALWHRGKGAIASHVRQAREECLAIHGRTDDVAKLFVGNFSIFAYVRTPGSTELSLHSYGGYYRFLADVPEMKPIWITWSSTYESYWTCTTIVDFHVHSAADIQ